MLPNFLILLITRIEVSIPRHCVILPAPCPGENWFGDDTARRIARWIPNLRGVSCSAPLLDLGCGNGTMIVELLHAGFQDIVGTDYCPDSVDLAARVINVGRVHNALLIGARAKLFWEGI